MNQQEIQGLQHEFNYKGTAREFANFLWQLGRHRYTQAVDGQRRWADLWPNARSRIQRDGTPVLVEYMGNRKEPFVDPADGQERTRNVDVLGITFVLDPLPYGKLHITAECHSQAFEEMYYTLLESFGVDTEGVSHE